MLFSELCDGFLLSRDAEGVSPRTLDWYRQQFRSAASHLPQSVDDIRIESVEAYIAAQRKVVSPSTVSARWRGLRALFGWAETRHGILSPMKGLRRPRVPDKIQRSADLGVYYRLVESITGDAWWDLRDRLIIHFLFWCGLRRAEVTGLRFGAIDVSKRTLKVVGKGGVFRVVPFPDFMASEILAYRYARPKWTGDHLWLSNDGSGGVRGVLRDEAINLMLTRRCRDAGLEKFNPHAFRHGYATELLNAGDLEMGVLSKLMGHSDEATTRHIYAKYKTNRVERDYRQAAARMLRE